MPRWSSFVGCELVKSAFSSPCPRRGHGGNCPAGGSARGGRRKRSQNEFNWGVKISQVDMDAPATSRWPAKWRRPHYCAVAGELIFSNRSPSCRAAGKFLRLLVASPPCGTRCFAPNICLRRQTFALTRQSHWRSGQDVRRRATDLREGALWAATGTARLSRRVSGSIFTCLA